MYIRSIQKYNAHNTLITILKNAKNDSKETSPLLKDNVTYTENKDKTNILHSQFQSAFSPKSPLPLSNICQMKVQDMIHQGRLPQHSATEGSQFKSSVTGKITVSESGVPKLLN